MEAEGLNLVHSCLPDAQINNWEFKYLPVVYTNDWICNNFEKLNGFENSNFTFPVDDTKNDYDEDYEPCLKLLRLVEQEAKEIKPHQEDVKIINLGEEGEEKQVKIGTSMSKEMQEQLYTLLQEFKDVFVWSYQNMSGMDPDIVYQKLPLKP